MTGRTVAHGYGSAHKRLRAQWAPLVAAGRVRCARCGGWIRPDAVWELDHDDQRAGYLGPSHRSCNRAAGLQKAIAQMALRRSAWRRW
jgi:hypothetical protein